MLKEYVRDIQDFPKKGILFKDITPLLASPEATNVCLQKLTEKLKNVKIDKVVGVESRGFFFGTLLAHELQVGFVPVRKAGKLPFTTVSASYELEYGTDTLEIHADAIQKGDKVLVHDDVLATGGTIKAVCELVEALGGEIIQVSFLMELLFLNGGDKIKAYNRFAVMEY